VVVVEDVVVVVVGDVVVVVVGYVVVVVVVVVLSDVVVVVVSDVVVVVLSDVVVVVVVLSDVAVLVTVVVKVDMEQLCVTVTVAVAQVHSFHPQLDCQDGLLDVELEVGLVVLDELGRLLPHEGSDDRLLWGTKGQEAMLDVVLDDCGAPVSGEAEPEDQDS
jgi:hypothetical protein